MRLPTPGGAKPLEPGFTRATPKGDLPDLPAEHEKRDGLRSGRPLCRWKVPAGQKDAYLKRWVSSGDSGRSGVAMSLSTMTSVPWT